MNKSPTHEVHSTYYEVSCEVFIFNHDVLQREIKRALRNLKSGQRLNNAMTCKKCSAEGIIC